MVGAALKKLIYVFTFSLLIFSPLPFGSVEQWAKLVLQMQAFLLFFVWLLWSSYGENKENPGIKNLLPVLIFLFVCLLQIVPLPGFVLGILSGKSLDIWKENQSILSSVGFPQGGSMFTISLYADATWKETLLLLSYVVFGLVVARSFRGERQLKILLIPILGIAFFEAAYGIYQYLLDVKSTVYPNLLSARGTYVNRNHFAGFLEMCIPLALGYVMSLGGRHDGRRRGSGRRSFFQNLISSDRLPKQAAPVCLLGVMLLALLLSKSRMGILSFCVSLIFFYVVYLRFKNDRMQGSRIPLVVIGVALLFGLWIGLYSIFERFSRIGTEASERLLVWKDMLNMIGDFPLFGTGFGTFKYVYLFYKESYEGVSIYYQAHNDYLQLMSETGVIGFVCLITALVLFITFSLKTLNRLSQEGNHSGFFLTLGALTGVVSILIHSLADFNLQIPANALYFAFLIGFIKAMGRGSDATHTAHEPRRVDRRITS